MHTSRAHSNVFKVRLWREPNTTIDNIGRVFNCTSDQNKTQMCFLIKIKSDINFQYPTMCFFTPYSGVSKYRAA